jgi:hypothetical protein
MITNPILLEDERDYPWQWFLPVIWSEAEIAGRKQIAKFEEQNYEGKVRREA